MEVKLQVNQTLKAPKALSKKIFQDVAHKSIKNKQTNNWPRIFFI